MATKLLALAVPITILLYVQVCMTDSFPLLSILAHNVELKELD